MFYLFHGNDAHSQKQTLSDLLARLDDPSLLALNTTRFTGQMRFGDLRQACDVIPFLAKRRVIIVEDLFTRTPDKQFMDQLLAYLPQLPDTARLFFLESQTLRDNHPLVKLAGTAENGYVRLFERPEGSALNRWVERAVAERGSEISPRAVHMLVSNVGNDLTLMEQEIEKLTLYRGPGQRIQTEDVEKLCPYMAEANIFDLVDAIGNRNARQAALLLNQKLVEGADPFYLFAMFVRQFRLLIQVKEVAESAAGIPEVRKRLNLHPYVAGKLYQQSQGFSMAQLEKIYTHLLDIDVGEKTGRADMLTSLNLLVAALTA